MNNSDLKILLAQRYYNKRRLGVPVDNRNSSAHIDIVSGLAEKYAADFLGCEFNYKITDGGDEGYDFIYRGYKADVKWLGYIKGTQKPRYSGRIIVDLHKIDNSDIYIAVCGSEEEGFNLIGWCFKEDLKREPLWVSLYPDINGKYERYAIHTSKMRKIM